MDSLSQIALGSAVAVATMGRRTALWKPALWGAVAGTLPDLDALIDHGDAILNMVLHRAETHALLYLTLLAPLLAWLVARLHGERALLGRWWLALWLVLITHPLLDAMTVYGTQLLLPFSSHPFGVGSVFIIDPAYTLPLLIGTGLALVLRKQTRALRFNAAGLVLSTAYLAWSVVAQAQVERVARASLLQSGIEAQSLLVTPAPFNTVLWRLIAITPTHYHEGHYSLLDATPTVRWYAFPRGSELIAQHGNSPPVARIAAFSKGFFRLRTIGDQRLLITDLRMGQEPAYVFTFDVGPLTGVGSVPAVQLGQRMDVDAGLAWLWQRMRGIQVPPPGLVPAS